MNFNILTINDWLSKHPKVTILISVILFLALCYLEEIA